MAIAKRLNLNSLFIFLFFAVFPFGQIIKIGILQPIDVIAGLGAAFAIFKKFPKPQMFKYFQNTLLIFLFSWLFGSVIFGKNEVFYGLLYLIRLSAYLYFFIYIWNFAGKGVKNRSLLLNSLLSVSVISAIFGWMQFASFPDLKPFFVWGWDMHLFRLVGTFLDPTFLGLIIVFGIIISIERVLSEKNKNTYLAVIIFLLVSLAFTYSRASYLALFAGLITIAWYKKFIGKAVASMLLFAGLMLLLPTSKNHSIELFRSFSAIARVENYQSTLKIFSKSPVFGIGYDNLCLANQKYIGSYSFSSHACSGSDSSLLFVLATTGVAGFIVFVYNLILIGGSLKKGPTLLVLGSTFLALIVHSLFSNSFFYPWIVGWILILLSVSLRREG